ncbi:MAG: glycyl-radical enzyme activating protein [Candidatus Hodarchaeota archaeon]
MDLNSKWRIDRNSCSLCTKCVEECYADTMVIFGSKMTVSEVMEEVEKDKPFYSETNGGITLSGGEPTLQIEFAHNLLLECKRRGISTIIETSGYFKWEKFEVLLSVLDYVLFDLKVYREKTHIRYCGYSNRIILQNAQKLSKAFPNVIFRMPIIPKVNDDKQNIQLICQFVKKQGKKELHLIPYHKLGYGKYHMLGRQPSDKHIELADQKVQMKVKKLVEKEGLIPVLFFQ